MDNATDPRVIAAKNFAKNYSKIVRRQIKIIILIWALFVVAVAWSFYLDYLAIASSAFIGEILLLIIVSKKFISKNAHVVKNFYNQLDQMPKPKEIPPYAEIMEG